MGKSISKKKLCSQPAPIARAFDASISSHRLKFIMTVTKKWANGTEIKYMFLEGPAVQQNVVRQAFQQWKDLVSVSPSRKWIMPMNPWCASGLT